MLTGANIVVGAGFFASPHGTDSVSDTINGGLTAIWIFLAYRVYSAHLIPRAFVIIGTAFNAFAGDDIAHLSVWTIDIFNACFGRITHTGIHVAGPAIIGTIGHIQTASANE